MNYNIPVDANPSNCALRLYPKDKKERNKGLNFKEYGEFVGVCKLGPNQLISCYQYCDEGYSKQDFLVMCKDCNYSLGRKSCYNYETSIAEPYFIENEWSELIDCNNPKSSNFVYFISDGEYVKIGVSNDIKTRISDLQVSNARNLDVICLIPTKDRKSSYELEKHLHWAYTAYSKNGEWFDILKFLNVDKFRATYPPEEYIK